ncbi:MAG: universal stress protein [Desulfobacterales bacterium]|jgi:nucleotide-binding universal stress UspA family protein
MTLQKFLWPTDFSDRAGQALDYVKSLTRKYEAEIHVLYVIEDVQPHPEWYGDFESDHVAKMLAWARRKARQRLDAICSEQLDDCPYFVRHIAVGDPAREILKLIEKANIDMVVMSTRGAKAHFRFGSVAEKVVKHAPVPVVTIPPARETAPAV